LAAWYAPRLQPKVAISAGPWQSWTIQGTTWPVIQAS
jgi:hypothetical protein